MTMREIGRCPLQIGEKKAPLGKAGLKVWGGTLKKG